MTALIFIIASLTLVGSTGSPILAILLEDQYFVGIVKVMIAALTGAVVFQFHLITKLYRRLVTAEAAKLKLDACPDYHCIYKREENERLPPGGRPYQTGDT